MPLATECGNGGRLGETDRQPCGGVHGCKLTLGRSVEQWDEDCEVESKRGEGETLQISRSIWNAAARQPLLTAWTEAV